MGCYLCLTCCCRALANGAGQLSRKSQSQVIVSGTLIRRSSGEVTDMHMKLARSGMTLGLELGLGMGQGGGRVGRDFDKSGSGNGGDTIRG